MPDAVRAKHNNNTLLWTAAFLAACVTFLVYLPALHNGFVNWDDDFYVYENKNIGAIGFGFLTWSLSAEVASLWHPLTLFSLAIDHAYWGLNPFGYHLTNISLHAINTFLVFMLVVRLTEQGAGEKEVPDKTALIAGGIASILFGLHPGHVESVAWVSERKDVLSAFFFLSAVLAYVRYTSKNIKRSLYYSYALIFFIMALMSKPMAVSLPIVLLILDFYPLKRLSIGRELKWVLIEKLPFLLSSIVSSMLTIWASRTGGALRTLETFPFSERIFVAAHSYMFYLVKMVFPFNLAPLYPHPVKIDPFELRYSGPLILLIVITCFCIVLLKRSRLYIAVWSYYAVSLAPVIGIVQVGEQAAADRYTYLPSLGPFILAGLLLTTVINICSKKYQLGIIVSLILLTMILVSKTERQISIWHDSITLWSNEIRLFPDIDTAYYNRGEAYSELGNYMQALRDSDKAIELNPTYGDAYYNRGSVYYTLGDYQQAIKDLSIAIELKTRYNEKAYNNRGIAYNSIGRYAEAVNDFSWAIERNPQDEFAYSNRGNAYFGLGDYQKAIKEYNKAIELNPRYVDAYNNRGYVYYILGNNEKSINDLKRAVEIDPGYAEAYYNLGLVYSRMGNDGLSRVYYKKAADLGSNEAKAYLDKEQH